MAERKRRTERAVLPQTSRIRRLDQRTDAEAARRLGTNIARIPVTELDALLQREANLDVLEFYGEGDEIESEEASFLLEEEDCDIGDVLTLEDEEGDASEWNSEGVRCDDAPDADLERQRGGAPVADIVFRLVPHPLYGSELILFSGIADRLLLLSGRSPAAEKHYQALERRIRDLMRLAQILGDSQRASLLSSDGPIVPLRQNDVAQQLGVQAERMSALLAGSWLEAPSGRKPLADYFSRAVPEDLEVALVQTLAANWDDEKIQGLSDDYLLDRVNRRLQRENLKPRSGARTIASARNRLGIRKMTERCQAYATGSSFINTLVLPEDVSARPLWIAQWRRLLAARIFGTLPDSARRRLAAWLDEFNFRILQEG